jgi:hypothetical protein
MNAPTPSTAFKVNNLHAGEARMDLSKNWISRPADQRFLSLTALRDFTKKSFDASTESVIDNRLLELVAPDPKHRDDMNRLLVGIPDLGEAGFTHHSFNQLCSLAAAPAGHYRSLPSQIVADALNYGLRYNRPKDRVKTYAVDLADKNYEIRAVTGPDYGRIPDYEVAEAVMQVAGNGVGDSRWKNPGVMDWRTMIYDPETPVTKDTTTMFASDRDCFIFLVDDRNPIEVGKLPNGDPDMMFRGFYIQNSEVGSASLKLAAFYLRAICCNRIMWGVEGFQEITMRHSKYAPSRFVEECRPALLSFAEGSETKLRDAVEKAKAAKIAEDKDSALDFLQGRGFTRKRALDVFEAVETEEGRPMRTVWDAAQGITAVARSIPNHNDRVEFEGEARKLLDKVAA